MANKLQNVTIEDARIVFRNFSGAEGQFNAKGNRNFSVLLPEEVVEAMVKDGWNVKYLKPREEGDTPQPYLQIKVNYNGRPPRAVMITSRGRTNLDEESVSVLDWADIAKVDLIFRPYEWTVNGSSGVSAYLQTIFVTINEDALELKYANVPDSAQNALTAGASDVWEDLGEVEEQRAIESKW